MTTVREQTEEALRQTAERRAAWTPEFRAEVEALQASVPDMMSRLFHSPPIKGRQTFFLATRDEVAEFHLRGL